LRFLHQADTLLAINGGQQLDILLLFKRALKHMYDGSFVVDDQKSGHGRGSRFGVEKPRCSPFIVLE
jgi:hypothetical protein